jgi:hypothetical protein
MNKQEKAFLGAILLFLIVICTLIIIDVINGNNRVELWRQNCENKNGILLDRTYQYGKTTGHQYTCVKSNVIIE